MNKDKSKLAIGKSKIGWKFRWRHDRSFRLLTIGLLLFSSLTVLFLLQTLHH